MVVAQRGKGGIGLAVLALSCMAPPAIAAEGPLRAVIAVSDPARAGGGASALSRAAMARGADARRLEAPAPDALARAIAEAQSGDATMVLAVSAAARAEDGATLLYGFGTAPLPLERLLDDLAGAVAPEAAPARGGNAPADAAAGDADPAAPGGDAPPVVPVQPIRVVMVLDACATDPASRTAPVPPRPGLALALLPAPGEDCAASDAPGALAALAEAMAGQGDLAGLAGKAGAAWIMQPGARLPDLRPPAAASQPVRTATAAPTQIGAVASASGGDIILLPRGTAPVTILPASRAMPASGGVVLASASSGMRLAAPSGLDPAQLAARPTAPGMPEPSIIVGSLRPPVEDSTGAALTGGALGTGVEDRQRLRAEDAALYASLVEQGTFDPEPGALTASIQTELSRMGCYTGAVDGSWGNGSRGGVDAYFRQAGGQPVTREPEIALFRQIIAGAEVTCPAPVRAAPAAVAAPARTAPARTAPAATAAPRAAAPAAAAPARTAPAAPAQTPSLGNALRGTGIIR